MRSGGEDFGEEEAEAPVTEASGLLS
jgi:hypothetical protein